MRALISTLVAGGLLAASTAHAATGALPAAPRSASPAAGAEQAGDDAWIWVGAGVVLLILLLVIIDDGNDHPESP